MTRATMTRDEKIDEMLAVHEITQLLYTYCNAADRHDHVKMRSLYHPDAWDDHGSFFKGPAMEFIDRLPEIQAPMEILHHNMTSKNIVVKGDKAEGEIYMIAFHRFKLEDGPENKKNGSADLLVGGRYFDNYERRDGTWKFTLRAAGADWAYYNAPSKTAMDHPMIAPTHIGKAGPEDPSYQFFEMMKFGQKLK